MRHHDRTKKEPGNRSERHRVQRSLFVPMENISKSVTSDNASPSLNRLSEPFDTGYRPLQPHEADPDPDKPPQANGTPADPDWQSDTMKSTADVRARWAREPRCKVGAATGRILIVALGEECPEFDETLRALQAENTAALPHRLHSQRLFFFKMPQGARAIDYELAPGVEVLVEGYDYLDLPSGSPTDTGHWLNRYAIAPAP
jgi:hypothetical protein